MEQSARLRDGELCMLVEQGPLNVREHAGLDNQNVGVANTLHTFHIRRQCRCNARRRWGLRCGNLLRQDWRHEQGLQYRDRVPTGLVKHTKTRRANSLSLLSWRNSWGGAGGHEGDVLAAHVLQEALLFVEGHDGVADKAPCLPIKQEDENKNQNDARAEHT